MVAEKPVEPLQAEQFELVATLRKRAIEASIDELRRQDELTLAVRQAVRNGADLNNLSEASGLTVGEIKSRMHRELFLGEDLETLVGLR